MTRGYKEEEDDEPTLRGPIMVILASNVIALTSKTQESALLCQINI